MAIVFTLAAGFIVTIVRYYVPLMYLASIFLITHIGLLVSLRATTPVTELLGYQVLGSAGLGLALQQGFLAAQTVLGKEHIPVGLSLMVLSQTLGGSVSLTTCQAILKGTLKGNLADSGTGTGIDPDVIANFGATDLRGSIAPEKLPQFLRSYNVAMQHMWYLPLALAALSLLAAAGMAWKRVTSQKPRLVENTSESEQASIMPAEKTGSIT